MNFLLMKHIDLMVKRSITTITEDTAINRRMRRERAKTPRTSEPTSAEEPRRARLMPDIAVRVMNQGIMSRTVLRSTFKSTVTSCVRRFSGVSPPMERCIATKILTGAFPTTKHGFTSGPTPRRGRSSRCSRTSLPCTGDATWRSQLAWYIWPETGAISCVISSTFILVARTPQLRLPNTAWSLGTF